MRGQQERTGDKGPLPRQGRSSRLRQEGQAEQGREGAEVGKSYQGPGSGGPPSTSEPQTGRLGCSAVGEHLPNPQVSQFDPSTKQKQNKHIGKQVWLGSRAAQGHLGRDRKSRLSAAPNWKQRALEESPGIWKGRGKLSEQGKFLSIIRGVENTGTWSLCIPGCGA